VFEVGVYDNIEDETCIFKIFVNSKTIYIILAGTSTIHMLKEMRSTDFEKYLIQVLPIGHHQIDKGDTRS